MKYRWKSEHITKRDIADGQKIGEFLEHIEDAGWEIFQFFQNKDDTEVICRRPREDG